MQPLRQLTTVLSEQADSAHSLFTVDDLQAVLPHQDRAAFRVLLSRAEKQGYLKRICRGI